MGIDTEKVWLITFGQRYARYPHPVDPSIHPDGVVGVYASSEDEAKRIAFKYFGEGYSMVHPITPGYKAMFPRGIIGQVLRSGRITFNANGVNPFR